MPSDPLVTRVRAAAAEAAVATAWAQWARLGFLAGGVESRAGEAIVDPEALLVLTFDAVGTESRLDQALAWWAVRGAGLLSLPRLDYVLREVPADLDAALARFAARVWGAGHASGSWKKRADAAGLAAEPPPDRLKGTTAPRLATPQALVLRTRSFSTIGAKADVLAYLAAQGAEPSTVARITKALGYTESAIRQALADLEAAGLAATERRTTTEAGRDPARYQFRPGTFDAGAVPPWRFWPQIAAFLLGAARWGADLTQPTPFLLASRARRLHALLDAFRIEHALPEGYAIADPTRHPGEAYLEPFAATVEAVARWLADGLPVRAAELANGNTEAAPPRPARLTSASRSLMDAFADYLRRVEATLATGDATEHSHRPALQALLEAAGGGALGRPPSVVNEPRRTRVGAPDFIIRLGGAPLGYVEAKDVGVALDPETEQLRRYRAGLQNLVFTDGLTFRWFAGGQPRDAVTLAERDGARLRPRDGAAEALADLLGAFFRFDAPAVTTARELAARLAAATRLLRDAIERAFGAEEEHGSLHGQFEAFRDVLLHDLTPARFADTYAQTLAYGLFAARAAAPEATGFSRLTAAAHLPRTNPFLQKLFYYVAGPDLDDRVAWLVDDLAALLARADLSTILDAFGRRTRQEDAVVHFYETFLQAYDPALRELRGVYYTPEPVVSYLVRSVDALLVRDFGLADGLASAERVAVEVRDAPGGAARAEEFHRVQVLDPAAGTGTFLHAVVRAIHARFADDAGLWDGYVAEHLLPRLHGFELLMAPYTVAHLKLGLLLQDTGYTFSRDERLSLFLTNTLDDAGPAGELPFARWLAEEAEAAGRVKRDVPVMVVVGNPPYSGHSANPSERPIKKIKKGERYVVGWQARPTGGAEPVWRAASRELEDVMQPTPIGQLIRDYFFVDGQPLGEKNPKWLNDDYVKFIRIAQARIEGTGQGVLAFVTNHGFLDNPTFRGMRQSLTAAFDRLYLLDLHGNAKKKETAPDGGRDENVFDIMQGVALMVGVRLSGPDGPRAAEVFHADLWGPRADKYAALDAADVTTTAWARLAPQSPAYLFRPQDRTLLAEYEGGWKMTDIFPVSNTGMVTARDGFVLGFDRNEVLERVRDFARLPLEEAARKYDLRDTRERTLAESQQLVRAMPDVGDAIQTVLWRPFDERPIFYHHALVRWPVYEVMRHMLNGENVGLITTRQTRDEWGVLVTTHPIRHKALAAYDINTLFPLWLYPAAGGGLFAPAPRTANLATSFVAVLEAATGLRYAEHGPAPPALRVHRSAQAPAGLSPSSEGDSFARGGSAATAREAGGGTPNAFTPEDAFHYVYGLLHAPAYRARYADFLRADFPRVPLPPSEPAFRALADVGRHLVALHLLKDVPAPAIGYPVKGSNAVEKLNKEARYVPPGRPAPDGSTSDGGRVYVNATQYFEGVEPEVWAHEVGGYQPLAKWLADRVGRALTYDDLRRYPRIAAALRETQRLMAEANEAAIEAFGW